VHFRRIKSTENAQLSSCWRERGYSFSGCSLFLRHCSQLMQNPFAESFRADSTSRRFASKPVHNARNHHFWYGVWLSVGLYVGLL